MNKKSSSLPLGLKIGYGIYDFGDFFFYQIILIWFFIYLTDVIGLKAGLAGLAIVLVRAAEILAAPVCGYFANHVHTRWGRRRPFLLFGAIPTGISFAALFWGPSLTSQAAIFAWAFTTFLISSLLFTAMNIPYSALTCDLTPDPHERTVLNAWRIVWATAGQLIAAAAIQPIIHLFPTIVIGYRAIGMLFGALIVLSTVITFATVREPTRQTENLPREGLISSHKLALSSRKLLFYMISWLITMIALGLMSTAIPYYFKYILRQEDMASPALGIFILISILFVPFWVWISKRIGKKQSYLIGMLWMGIVICFISIFAPGWSTGYILGGMVVVAFGYAAVATLASAILPDVIDDHYNLTGRRHEGIAYGLWLVATKAGMLIAAGIFGAVLSLTNYHPEVAQFAALQQKTVIGIIALTGPLPLIFMIIASIFLFLPSPLRSHTSNCASSHSKL